MAKIPEITSLDESFVNDVKLRLESFGYQVQEPDTFMITFCIQKVVNTIKNECNVSAIPDGLYHVAVDMVCGEFLFVKKGSGQLQGFDLDIETAVKQIQEGDTNIVFAIEGNITPEQRLNSLITYLMNSGYNQFVSYRRLRW